MNTYGDNKVLILSKESLVAIELVQCNTHRARKFYTNEISQLQQILEKILSNDYK